MSPYPMEHIAPEDWAAVERMRALLAKDMNPPVPQARVFNSANISIPDNAITALTFNSERFDNGGLHSTSANTSRLTAPITGVYLIGGNVTFAFMAAIAERQAFIRLNGATDIARANQGSTPGDNARMDVLTLYQLTAGDYVELTVYQLTGGALNVLVEGNCSPEFWMVRLGGFTNQGV